MTSFSAWSTETASVKTVPLFGVALAGAFELRSPVGNTSFVASWPPPAPFTVSDAETLVRVRSRRIVVAGLALAAAIAMVSAGRAVIESPPDLVVRRFFAGALVVAIAVAALAQRQRVVPGIERDDRWLMAWSALIVLAFVIGGPGEEMLLSAALGPIGLAGLVGRLRSALLCALIIDVGYVGELALEGHSAFRVLQYAAANCAFVLMTVAIFALPVRLAVTMSENVAEIVGQWRLDPSRAPRVVRTARYLALPSPPLLTEQELRVVKLIGQGLYYAAIARAEQRTLGRSCSERTIRKIVARIKKKTGATTRAEIVFLVDLESPR